MRKRSSAMRQYSLRPSWEYCVVTEAELAKLVGTDATAEPVSCDDVLGIQKMLNERFGADGWELCAATTLGMFFKRPR